MALRNVTVCYESRREKAAPGSRPSLGRFLTIHAIGILAIAALWGCGGSGNSGGRGGQTPTPSPDFSISLSQQSLTVSGGASASIAVSVSGSNGFNSAVVVQITGLPTGVSVSPTSLQVTAGTPQQLTFTAAAYVAASSTTVTLTGSSASLSHKTQLSLATEVYPGNPSLSRTRYIRTDAATPYNLWPNDSWIVYDPGTNRFFVTDPSNNQIIVLDAARQTEIGTMAVPGAYGIDEAPDHTTLYAGTQMGDVYAIDPVAMKVVHRYIASQIGPDGYHAYSVRVLANGKLVLLGGQGGIPSVDGYSGFAIWNPIDNSIVIHGVGNRNPPSTNVCTESGHIFGFKLTGDRSMIVLSAGNSLCTLDLTTGEINFAAVVGSPIPTPDGKLLLILQYGVQPQILVYDARTLSQQAAFPLSASGAAMAVSPDSKTVFVAEGGAQSLIVYAYDIATGRQIGWLPNISVSFIVGGLATGPVYGPNFQAIDNTGLLAGPMEEGVGFLDTAALQTGPVGTQFLGAYINPATGPATGGTQAQWGGSASGNLRTIYFGKNLASSISQASGSSGFFYATTPPGAPGPVDVYALMTDGGTQVIPEGFSYGPAILEATPDSATAEGGGTGIVYGYGFGPTNGTTIPSDLQISVGGKPATITAYYRNAYGVSSPPFPLQAAAYTIPAGVAGESADITVTTQAGTATLSSEMHYLPAVQQFPLSGAVLAQGIYDTKRDLYYFTDATDIQVFSRTSRQWLSPIQVPAAPGSKMHRLWGIALSHDGSKLTVSDANTGIIYLINPDSTGSVQSFALPGPYFAGAPLPISGGVVTIPAGLAISDAGMVYFPAFTVGGSGYDGFFKLDTRLGKFTDYGVRAFGNSLYRTAISSDNSRVFFNDDGSVFSVDTATDKVFSATVAPGCCYGDYDLSLSDNQTRLEATSYLYDVNLDGESYLTLNIRESLNISYVYGTKLSPNGSLLFQPSTNGIDVFDGKVGTLRTRISLPVALSQNYDALVSDGKDNVLIAITGQNGNGIAIVDLSSLPEPSPLPYQKDGPDRTLESAWNEHHAFSPANAHGAQGTVVQRKVPRTAIRHVTNMSLLQKR